jgi:dual specificity phosphatase 12
VILKYDSSRKTLATTPYILHHIPKSSSTVSPYAPISSLVPTPAASTACQHHHLTPLSWMRPLLAQGLLSGRLDCPNPKCGAQIGRYAWQGLQCSCGVWVIPGFTLAKGRVDEIVKNPVSKGRGKDNGGGNMGIRMPPGMREKI